MNLSLWSEKGTEHLHIGLDESGASLHYHPKKKKPPAGCSYLRLLSVSVAGGNEAILSCRPCSGFVDLADR